MKMKAWNFIHNVPECGAFALLLEHLMTFARVVETGSVTQAAQELGLSQPAVTKRMARLEEDLAARLLDRRSDRVTPTAAGELVYRHARRLGDGVQAMLEELRALDAPGRGELRLAAVDTMVLFTLPPLLAEYRRLQPGVAVRVRIGSIQETVDLVLRAEVDVGMATVPVEDPRLYVRPLFWDPVVVVAAPEVAAALGPDVRPADLAGVGVVTYAAGSRFRAYVDALLAQEDIELPVTMEFDNHEAVRVMALLGYGAALVPETVVEADLADGRLRRVAVAGLPVMGRTSALLYRRDTPPLAAAARFVELVTERYKGQAPPVQR